MVSNLLPLIFRSRPLGITARKPSLERGQVPHVGTSFACGRNSPQCKLVGAPSDACGHLLFMLGVHSLPPMERVASVRAPATVKRSSVSCTQEKKSSAKIGSGPRSTAESSASAAGAASSGPWGMAVKLSKRGKTKFFSRSARSAGKLQRTFRAFRRRTRGLCRHGMAWSGNETPRWVCKHRSWPIRPLKHPDKRQFDPSTEWLSRFAQCPHGRRVPSEGRAGVRGAWHAVLERAVSPGGSTSTVESPYASQNTAQRGILPWKTVEFSVRAILDFSVFSFSGQGSPEAAFGPHTAKLLNDSSF